jgi:LDH2 family malate/lactate/ureidoglycolate dehydrogenase
MNRPPDSFIRIDADALGSFVSDVFVRSGVSPERATFLSGLLVANDLRGVFSHGTRQAVAYVGHFRRANSTPRPRCA